ncbi:MAG: ECF-type sigma factor [Phycisphaerae bacterium]
METNNKAGGDTEARPLASMYDELRSIAEHYMGGQKRGHTLQPTALVHEAFLRVLKHERTEQLSASELLGLAARAMRSVLVDHARRRGRQKRGGNATKVPLDNVVEMYEERAIDLIALDDALTRLAQIDTEQATVVELRFFGGLSEEETATLLGVSARTIGRVWRRARAWLRNEMGERNGHDR